MCLYANSRDPITSSEPKTCYKIMKLRDNYDGRWRTAYIGMPVEDDVMSGEEMMTPLIKEQKIIYDSSPNGIPITIVENGFIHTFAHLKDAEEEIRGFAAEESRNRRGNRFVIFECVIPSDTPHFKGTFLSASQGGLESYASIKVRVIRKVSDNKMNL